LLHNISAQEVSPNLGKVVLFSCVRRVSHSTVTKNGCEKRCDKWLRKTLRKMVAKNVAKNGCEQRLRKTVAKHGCEKHVRSNVAKNVANNGCDQFSLFVGIIFVAKVFRNVFRDVVSPCQPMLPHDPHAPPMPLPSPPSRFVPIAVGASGVEFVIVCTVGASGLEFVIFPFCDARVHRVKRSDLSRQTRNCFICICSCKRGPAYSTAHIPTNKKL
jgi:hypothetical protein